MNAQEQQRALQPPFSKLLTKIVSNKKWDAAQALRSRQRYLKFMFFVGIMYGFQGLFEIFETHKMVAGSISIVIALINVIAFFVDNRKLQKMSRIG